jgi:hypothetical protein
MKRFSFSVLMLSGLLALPVSGMLVAAAPDRAATWDDVQIANGTIKEVDTERSRFVLATGEQEVEISYTRRTQFTLNGEESTMEEALKAGHEANVRHRNNIAIRVDATAKSQPQQHLTLFGLDDVQSANGSIKSVDAERNRFVMATGDGDEEITIRVNERTQYTLDGEESTKEAALKEGHHVNVRHRNNMAIRVDATTRTE